VSTARLIIGSVLHELRALEAGSVDLVVTSPPFLAVRDYDGGAGDPMARFELGRGGTPQSFVGELLDVVEACGHALAPHGSIVLELGDSMAGSGGAGGDYYNDDGQRAGQPKPPGAAKLARQDRREDAGSQRRPAAPPMRQSSPRYRGGTQRWDKREGVLRGGDTVTYPLAPKSGEGWPLDKSHAMVPEMLRMAMAYGEQPYTDRHCTQWIIRNVVRWCKPNPSVGDEGDKYRRATTDMLVATRSEDRFWDALSARGPSREGDGSTAPLYDWWELPTGSFTGAHFATFPLELVQPFVASLCPHRVCTECGEPARRIIRTSDEYAASREPGDMFATLTGENDRSSGRNGATSKGRRMVAAQYEHAGWTWCGHGGVAHQLEISDLATWKAAGRPRWPIVRVGEQRVGYFAPGSTIVSGDPSSGRRGVVLDPFAGSGTTLAAATGAGRDAIGIELYAKHAELAVQRIGPMFLEIEQGHAHELEDEPEPAVAT
jgi:hypothetical protein